MDSAVKRNRYEIDMCNGTVLDKLISFSIPLMLSGILQLLFNAVDIIVVGRFTGSQALAAVGSTTALINVFTNLFIGVSLGANVLAARFYASGQEKKMSETVHTAITFALTSGIVMVFVGLFFSRTALELMDTPADVIEQSALYMRIYFAGMPFFMLYNYGAAILRAVGDTKRPLFFLMIGLKWIYLKQIFQVGSPAGIQSTVINFSNVLLQSSVNSFGSVAMAGYTAANNIFGFLFASVNSITQACMSFTSQNYSVGKWKRMDKILRNCILLSVAVSIVMGGGSYLMGPQLLRVYTSDAAVIQCGMEILLYTTVTYFMCGLMDLFPGALRGMGFSAVPMLLSVIGTVGTRIVWIFWVFPKHRSLDVLFISYPASWFLTIVLQVICYCFVRRKLKKAIVTAKI